MGKQISIKESPLAQVGEAEAGQKLIQFLDRRLHLPWSLLQRWIRTGQIRINGKRSKPFDILKTGDQVRVPPFALHMALAGFIPQPPHCSDRLPPLLGVANEIWAFNKPAGLPIHGGSKMEDSLTNRLAAEYAEYAFKPVPVHRLDKDTSGVVLVASSFQALKSIHEQMRSGAIQKEYLAVVSGIWPEQDTRTIKHYLDISDNITAYSENGPGRKETWCRVKPVKCDGSRTLLQIRLGTGRKRQIRVQLAALGYPVVGDNRYGTEAAPVMKLHSMRVILTDNMEFSCLPPWAAEYGLETVPVPLS